MCVCVERINIYLFIYLFTPRPPHLLTYIEKIRQKKTDLHALLYAEKLQISELLDSDLFH